MPPIWPPLLAAIAVLPLAEVAAPHAENPSLDRCEGTSKERNRCFSVVQDK